MLETLMQLDQTLTLLINGSSSLWLDGFAVAVSATVTWIPAALVLFYVFVRRGEMADIAASVLAVGLCILLADQIASGLFKPLVARPRPAGDPFLMLCVDVVNDYRGGKYGFFSSHASNTFAVATFVALLVRYRALTLTMLCWALLNCWSRVYLGVHYVGDVLCGAFCGILVGSFVYWLYRKVLLRLRIAPSEPASDVVNTSTGYATADANLLAVTLVLLFVYCCFRGLFFS